MNNSLYQWERCYNSLYKNSAAHRAVLGCTAWRQACIECHKARDLPVDERAALFIKQAEGATHLSPDVKAVLKERAKQMVVADRAAKAVAEEGQQQEQSVPEVAEVGQQQEQSVPEVAEVGQQLEQSVMEVGQQQEQLKQSVVEVAEREQQQQQQRWGGEVGGQPQPHHQTLAHNTIDHFAHMLAEQQRQIAVLVGDQQRMSTTMLEMMRQQQQQPQQRDSKRRRTYNMGSDSD